MCADITTNYGGVRTPSGSDGLVLSLWFDLLPRFCEGPTSFTPWAFS